jgi:hypothetical protein
MVSSQAILSSPYLYKPASIVLFFILLSVADKVPIFLPHMRPRNQARVPAFHFVPFADRVWSGVASPYIVSRA